MEVMVGPTFSIEVSVSDEYVGHRSVPTPPDKTSSSAVVSSACILLENGVGGCPGRPGNGIGLASGTGLSEYSSESSSSIGTPGDSEDEVESGDEDDDAVSCKEDRLRGLGSLIPLEDSLPIKRGLSNHYKGKSKSFGNLAEISSVKEVEKQENPLNKRRRLQICSKWSRRSFYSWQNPKSMPLLPVNEGEGGDEEDDDEDDEKSRFDEAKSSVFSSSDDDESAERRPKLQPRNKSFKAKTFKSQSCFALSDLQEEEDQ